MPGSVSVTFIGITVISSVPAFIGVTLAAIGNLGLSFALGAISNALTPKPDAPSSFASELSDRNQTVRQAITNHQVIFGEVRTGGAVTFLQTRFDDGLFDMVVTFAGHEIDSFKNFYYDDEELILDASGKPTGGTWNDGGSSPRTRIVGGTGSTAGDATFNAELQTNLPGIWTVNHRQSGRAKAYIQGVSEAFPNGIPNVTFIVRGLNQIFDPRDSSTGYSNNAALCIRKYLTDTSFGLGELSSRIDDASFIAAANICDENVRLTASIETVSITSSSVANPSNILCAAAHGMETNDVVEISGHSGSTPDINGFHTITKVDDTNYTIPINVTAGGTGGSSIRGGSEKRYTINGTVDTGREPRLILQEMLGACAGTLTYQGGKWVLYVGAYRTPTITFDDDVLDGPITVQTRVGRAEIFNKVKGIFVNPDDLFQPTDFPIIENETYFLEDGSEALFKDVSYKFTTSNARAQRLAKIELERARQQITVQYPTNLNGLRVQVGDTVNITNDKMGWSSKPFEVTDFAFVTRPGEDAPRVGIDLTLRETASTVFDWADGEETVLDPAPNSNLPNPFVKPLPPINLSVDSGNEGLVTAGDGTVIVHLHASWTSPSDAFIAYFETQFKLSSSSVWTNGPDVIDNNEVLLGPVSDGTTWDVQVRSVNQNRLKSDFADARVEMHPVAGKSAVPTDVSTFNFSEQPDGTRLYSWTHTNVPADVSSGGGYEIRYFVGSTSSWTAMTKLNPLGLLKVSPFESNQLVAGTYTFAIKAVDSSGNESANAKFISSVVLDDPRIGEALINRVESSLSFPGTLFDCTLSGGVLLANANGEDWRNLPGAPTPQWTDMAGLKWHELIASKTPIMYTTPEIDLGSDVKMSPLVNIQGVGTPTITMQTGTAADGAVTGTVTITSSSVANPSNILCAAAHGMVTNDVVEISGHSGSVPNINGLHTITKVDATNFTIPVNVTTGGTGGSSIFFKPTTSETIQYIKLRVSQAGANPVIQEMISIISAPSKIETFDDVNTASETATWFNSIAAGHFQIGSKGGIGQISQASIKAIQNVGSGFSWELINKTSTVNSEVAAEFKVYNSGGTLTNAVVDVELRGAKK